MENLPPPQIDEIEGFLGEMKDERLKKLHDLLKGLLYTYNTKNYNLTAVLNDIGNLCSSLIFNESFNENLIGRDELLWCNKTWKKYDCHKIDFEKIDWDKWDLTNGELETGNEILFSVWKTTGAYPNKDDDYGYVNTFVIFSDGERIDSAWGFDEYSGKTLFRNNYYPTGDDGYFTLWYENGQKEVEGTYKDGEKNGKWTNWWYRSGEKKYEGKYKDGEKDGKWTEWYKNGKKRSEGKYKDGKLISQKCWDKDGNIIDIE